MVSCMSPELDLSHSSHSSLMVVMVHTSINKCNCTTLSEALVSGGQFLSQRATVSSYITIDGAEVRALTFTNLKDIKEWSQKFSAVILLIRNERTCAAICDVICNHYTCVIVM